MRAEQAAVRNAVPEPEPAQPATEARGGLRPDWGSARPGEELGQLPDPELHDPPAAP